MTAEFIANHLWQSSCFALLASLLAFMLRGNSPRVRYLVWLSASIKFLVPWVLLVSLGTVVPWPGHHAAVPASSTLPDTLVQIVDPFPPDYAIVPTRAHTHSGVIGLTGLWAVGFIAIAFKRCRSFYGIRAMLRAASPVKLPITVPAVIAPIANEPGIVGFLRPVLVLPALLLERLNSEQLEALLAHELCHVRRRDNFFAAVHMGVEAIFWFHPVVWWIGSRMLEEREMACDEEVLRQGCKPTEYARGILTVCEHCSEAPLACVSGVTGADIKKRLKMILRGTLPSELSGHKKVVLTLAAVAVTVLPVGLGVWSAPPARAQSARQILTSSTPRPSFEVAAIKVNNTTEGPGTQHWGSQDVTLTGARLLATIAEAYQIPYTRIVAPDDSRSRGLLQTNYDITAKSGRSVTKPELLLMLQTLFEDRFKMTVHHEARTADVYKLVVAKGGPKLEESKTDGPASGTIIPGGLTMKNTEIWRFCALLSGRMGRPVIDQTGLGGQPYDFTLRLDTLEDISNSDPDAKTRMSDWSSSSIFSDIQKQLGFQLLGGTAPVDYLVIDHIEAPSEN